MKILVADDDHVSRQLIEASLRTWGYDVLMTRDGSEAWDALQQEDAPRLAILDWMMPGLDGIELCKKVRETAGMSMNYVIMLTAKTRKSEVVTGLEAGADDYLTKPFDPAELSARLRVGVRVLELQTSQHDLVKKLEAALSQVKQLQGIVPICSHCKRVRNDENYWQQVESYISAHSEARFSHSICPGCYAAYVKPDLEKRRSRTTATE